MDILTQFTLPAICLLLTLGFGLWLGLRGQPYNGLLFNFHKLIALGTVILTAYRLYPLLITAAEPAWLSALALFAAACVVALFASGALLSMNKPPYDLLRRLHTLTPFLMALALGLILYVLAGRSL